MPQRGIQIIVLVYTIISHTLNAYPVSSSSQRQFENSHFHDNPPYENLYRHENPLRHEHPYSTERDAPYPGEHLYNPAMPPATILPRRNYPQRRHSVASRRLQWPDSARYAAYPSPESGTEVFSTRPVSKLPVSETDPLSNIFTESDVNVLPKRSDAGSSEAQDNGQAVMRVQHSERSDSWSPNDQDTIMSNWMHTIGSLFGYGAHNSTVKSTPTPSPSPSPFLALLPRTSSVEELENLEQDLDRQQRLSTSTLHSNEGARMFKTRSENGRLVRYRRPYPVSRDEPSSAEYWDPPFSYRSEPVHSRPRQLGYGVPSLSAQNRDVRDPRNIVTPIRSQNEPHEYSISHRLPVETINNDANTIIPYEHVNSRVPVPNMKYNAGGRGFSEGDVSNDVNVDDSETQGEDSPSEQGIPSNDPLSRVEAIEMVRLFRRLFETLDVTLDGHENVKSSRVKDALPPGMHIALSEAKKLNRLYDHEMRDVRDEISDRDRPDDTAVARALASAARAAAKAESAESNSLDFESQLSSVDKPADADGPVGDVPPYAPAYGSRKKLLEAKSKGALGDLYESLTKAIKTIL